MSVSATIVFATDVLYVPFRGSGRQYSVGTFQVRGSVVGDGSGGTATILLSMVGDELGFPALYVPTLITVQDQLATAEVVRITYVQAGLERVGSGGANFVRAITPVTVAATNFGELAGSSPILSVVHGLQAAVNVMSALWATNETGDTYQFLLYGLVYDEQYQARRTDLDVHGPQAGAL